MVWLIASRARWYKCRIYYVTLSKQLIFLKARLPICPMGLKTVPTSIQWDEYGSTRTRAWRCLIHFRDDYYYYSRRQLSCVGIGLAFLSLEKYYIILFWLCLKNGMILILSGEVSFPSIEK